MVCGIESKTEEATEGDLKKGGVLWPMAQHLRTALVCTLRIFHPAIMLVLLDQLAWVLELVTTVLHTRPDRRHQPLLSWLQATLPERRDVLSLDAAWRDGSVLCELVQSAVPGSYTGGDIGGEPWRLGQTLAYRHLGVQPAFSAADFLQSSLSKSLEQRLCRYLSAVRAACVRLQVTPPPPAGAAALARGMGLVMAVQERRALFYLYLLRPDDHAEFLVQIHGPAGDFGSAVIPASDRPRRRSAFASKPWFSTTKCANIPIEYKVQQPGSICVSYVPRSAGRHELSVLRRGRHLPGSPYVAIVDRSAGRRDDDAGRWLSREEEARRRRLRVVFRIVDFVTEKMLLTEDGKLKRLPYSSPFTTRSLSMPALYSKVDDSPETHHGEVEGGKCQSFEVSSKDLVREESFRRLCKKVQFNIEEEDNTQHDRECPDKEFIDFTSKVYHDQEYFRRKYMREQFSQVTINGTFYKERENGGEVKKKERTSKSSSEIQNTFQHKYRMQQNKDYIDKNNKVFFNLGSEQLLTNPNHISSRYTEELKRQNHNLQIVNNKNLAITSANAMKDPPNHFRKKYMKIVALCSFLLKNSPRQQSLEIVKTAEHILDGRPVRIDKDIDLLINSFEIEETSPQQDMQNDLMTEETSPQQDMQNDLMTSGAVCSHSKQCQHKMKGQPITLCEVENISTNNIEEKQYMEIDTQIKLNILPNTPEITTAEQNSAVFYSQPHRPNMNNQPAALCELKRIVAISEVDTQLVLNTIPNTLVPTSTVQSTEEFYSEKHKHDLNDQPVTLCDVESAVQEKQYMEFVEGDIQSELNILPNMLITSKEQNGPKCPDFKCEQNLVASTHYKQGLNIICQLNSNNEKRFQNDNVELWKISTNNISVSLNGEVITNEEKSITQNEDSIRVNDESTETEKELLYNPIKNTNQITEMQELLEPKQSSDISINCHFHSDPPIEGYDSNFVTEMTEKSGLEMMYQSTANNEINNNHSSQSSTKANILICDFDGCYNEIITECKCDSDSDMLTLQTPTQNNIYKAEIDLECETELECKSLQQGLSANELQESNTFAVNEVDHLEMHLIDTHKKNIDSNKELSSNNYIKIEDTENNENNTLKIYPDESIKCQTNIRSDTSSYKVFNTSSNLVDLNIGDKCTGTIAWHDNLNPTFTGVQKLGNIAEGLVTIKDVQTNKHMPSFSNCSGNVWCPTVQDKKDTRNTTSFVSSSSVEICEDQFRIWTSDVFGSQTVQQEVIDSMVDFDLILSAPNHEEALRKFEKGLQQTQENPISKSNSTISELKLCSESYVEASPAGGTPEEREVFLHKNNEFAEDDIQNVNGHSPGARNVSSERSDSDYISVSSIQQSPENQQNDELRRDERVLKPRRSKEDGIMGPAEREIWGMEDAEENAVEKWTGRYFPRVLTPGTPTVLCIAEETEEAAALRARLALLDNTTGCNAGNIYVPEAISCINNIKTNNVKEQISEEKDGRESDSEPGIFMLEVPNYAIYQMDETESKYQANVGNGIVQDQLESVSKPTEISSKIENTNVVQPIDTTYDGETHILVDLCIDTSTVETLVDINSSSLITVNTRENIVFPDYNMTSSEKGDDSETCSTESSVNEHHDIFKSLSNISASYNESTPRKGVISSDKSLQNIAKESQTKDGDHLIVFPQETNMYSQDSTQMITKHSQKNEPLFVKSHTDMEMYSTLQVHCDISDSNSLGELLEEELVSEIEQEGNDSQIKTTAGEEICPLHEDLEYQPATIRNEIYSMQIPEEEHNINALGALVDLLSKNTTIKSYEDIDDDKNGKSNGQIGDVQINPVAKIPKTYKTKNIDKFDKMTHTKGNLLNQISENSGNYMNSSPNYNIEMETPQYNYGWISAVEDTNTEQININQALFIEQCGSTDVEIYTSAKKVNMYDTSHEVVLDEMQKGTSIKSDDEVAHTGEEHMKNDGILVYLSHNDNTEMKTDLPQFIYDNTFAVKDITSQEFHNTNDVAALRIEANQSTNIHIFSDCVKEVNVHDTFQIFNEIHKINKTDDKPNDMSSQMPGIKQLNIEGCIAGDCIMEHTDKTAHFRKDILTTSTKFYNLNEHSITQHTDNIVNNSNDKLTNSIEKIEVTNANRNCASDEYLMKCCADIEMSGEVSKNQIAETNNVNSTMLTNCEDLPVKMRVTHWKQYWDLKLTAQNVKGEKKGNTLQSITKKSMSQLEYLRKCNTSSPPTRKKIRSPSIRIPGIVNKWKQSFEAAKQAEEVMSTSQQHQVTAVDKSCRVANWRQYWENISTSQCKVYKDGPVTLPIHENCCNSNRKSSGIQTIPSVTIEDSLNCDSIHDSYSDNIVQYEDSDVPKCLNDHFRQTNNQLFEDHHYNLHIPFAILDHKSSVEISKENVTSTITTNGDDFHLSDFRQDHQMVSELFSDVEKSEDQMLAMTRYTPNTWYHARRVPINSDGECSSGVSTPTSWSITDEVHLLDKSKPHEDCIGIPVQEYYENMKEIPQKNGSDSDSTLSSSRDNPMDCNDEISGKKKTKHDSQSNFQRAKSFFQILEQAASKTDAQKYLYEMSEKRISAGSSDDERSQQKTSTAPRSAPETLSRLHGSRMVDGSRTLPQRKVCEQFYVQDLFRDVSGSSTGSLRGVPCAGAVLAALRSMEGASEKLISPHNELHYSMQDNSVLGYQLEYPYLPITPPERFRSRNILQDSLLITRKELITMK